MNMQNMMKLITCCKTSNGSALKHYTSTDVAGRELTGNDNAGETLPVYTGSVHFSTSLFSWKIYQVKTFKH